MIYDIRTSESAQQTLTNITGVQIKVWEQYIDRECEYECTNDFLENVIKAHGHFPHSYRDFEFIFFHVTTSANGCASYCKHGILDLKQAYLCHDSELRKFLEEHDIYIDLEEQLLTYCGESFDITFGDCPEPYTEAHNCWSIGRKFYFDYTICGFLSVQEQHPYSGQVHHRPEILMDIDNLLKTTLSQEWRLTHDPYEIVAKVNGEKIVYNGDDNRSDSEKVLNYLTKAYRTSFDKMSQNILYIKNHVQIPYLDILCINPIEHLINY